jgi:hypothetical protein
MNGLQAESVMHVSPAEVMHAEFVVIACWAAMQVLHADDGVPVGQAEAQSLAQGAPDAQPHEASW